MPENMMIHDWSEISELAENHVGQFANHAYVSEIKIGVCKKGGTAVLVDFYDPLDDKRGSSTFRLNGP